MGYQKIKTTRFPPPARPLFVWDGDCSFCRYWVSWLQTRSGGKLDFDPYQKVGPAFKDIPEREFRRASRLIEPDGQIYSGPDSAFRAYGYTGGGNYFLHRMYQKHGSFRKLSDCLYAGISAQRPFMYRLSRIFFGGDPLALKPYWVLYLVLLLLLAYTLL